MSEENNKIIADSEELAVEVSVKDANRYIRILEEIFSQNYKPNDHEVKFTRVNIEEIAETFNIRLPKNLGDVIYSFKYRNALPESIASKAPPEKEWVIVNQGRSKYAFVAKRFARVLPDRSRMAIKIPDATPTIVTQYALDDEQALLTKLRYNNLLNVFSGAVCYSLQNHLRTTVKNVGQVETDEIYVGVDKHGRQYVFPVQAKGGKDELGVVQIEQDIALCEEKFPNLQCRAIAAQFMTGDVIAMFEFAMSEGEVRKVAERHYKLVPADKITHAELKQYMDSGETE
jgi:hypothetical protein